MWIGHKKSSEESYPMPGEGGAEIRSSTNITKMR